MSFLSCIGMECSQIKDQPIDFVLQDIHFLSMHVVHVLDFYHMCYLKSLNNGKHEFLNGIFGWQHDHICCRLWYTPTHVVIGSTTFSSLLLV